MGFGRWALRLFGKAPVILTAVATAGPGDSQITLTWTTEENSIQIADYKIYDSDNNLITTITGITGNQNEGSVLLTNSTNPTYLTLENPNSYIFKIVARNYKGDGESQSFNSVSPFTKPGAPSSISVGANAFRQMTLTWTAASDNGGSPITNYKVYVYRNGVQIVGSPYTESNILTKTYNSLTDGNYTVSISVVNAAGEGPVRQLGSTFNIFDDPLVNTVTVTPGANQATFNFTSVTARSGTGPIDSYNIYANANKTTLLGTSTTSSVVVTTRDGTNPLVYNAAGYTMYASIKIRPNGGLIESTTPLTVTGIMPYSVPTNSTFTATAGDKSADFSWSFSSNGSTITDYIIYNSSDVRVNVAEIPYTNTTFNIGGLTNGTIYTYKVAAINAAGENAKTSVIVTPTKQYNPYDLSGERVGTLSYTPLTGYTYQPNKFVSIQYDSNFVYALVEKQYSNSSNNALIFKINKSAFSRATTNIKVTIQGFDQYSDSYLITQNTDVNGYTPKKAIIDSTNMYVFINSAINWKVLKVDLNSSTATGVAYTGSSKIIDLGNTVAITGVYTDILNIIKVGSTIHYFGRLNYSTINLSTFTKGTDRVLTGGTSILGASGSLIQHIIAVVYNSTTQIFYIFAVKWSASPYRIVAFKIRAADLSTATSIVSPNLENKIYDSTTAITKARTITYNQDQGFIYLHVDNTIYKVDDSDLTYEIFPYTTTTITANSDINYLYYTTSNSLLKYNNSLENLPLNPTIGSSSGYSFSTSEYERPTGTGTTLQDAFLYLADSNSTNTNIYKVKLPFFAPDTTTTPGAPTITVANTTTSGKVTITITPPTTTGIIIKQYGIQYKLSTDATYGSELSTKKTSYNITGLTVGSTYNFRARVTTTGDRTGAYSTVRSLKVNGAPYNGTLTATVSANTTDSTKSDIKLDWSFLVADATISPITSYTLQRKTTTGTIITTTPVSAQNIRTYTDSSITAGVSYDYIITATNNIGTSTAVTLRVAADVAPSAPTISGIGLSGSNWILSWTAPAATTSAPITGYKIGYKINSDANYTRLTPSGTGTTYNFGSSTLTRGQYYDFQVEAINHCGTGVVATSSNNPIGTVPSITVILTNGATIGSVDVNASTTSDFPITSYTIEYNNTGNNNVTSIQNITSLPYTLLTGYSNGTTAYVRMSAASLLGTSAMTGFSSIRIYGSPTFTFGTPTYGDRQVTLNFNGTPNGGTIRGYNIYNLIGGNYVRFNSGSTYTVTTASTSSSYTITALTDGTQLQRGSAYTFYGKTDNGLLTTNYTALTVTLPTLPGTPTGLTASFTSAAPITLSWTAPTPITNSAVTSYIVYYNTVNNNSTDTLYGTVTGTSASITGLTSGVTYYFTVAAVNQIGTGSKAAYITALYPNLPGAPTDLRINPSNLAFELLWKDPISNGGSSITSYKIYQNGVFRETISINNTTLYATGFRQYLVGGLTKNYSYNYQISAINAVGEGVRSNVSNTDTADSVPSPITNLSVTQDANFNFVLSWSPPSNYTQNTLNYIWSYTIGILVEDGVYGSVSTYSPNNDILGIPGTINIYTDRSIISSSIQADLSLYEVIQTNTVLYTQDGKTSGIKIITNNATQYTSAGQGPSTGLVAYTSNETGVPPLSPDNQYYTIGMNYTNLTDYASNRSITIGVYNPIITNDSYPNVLRRYVSSQKNILFYIKANNRYGSSSDSGYVTSNPNSSYRR